MLELYNSMSRRREPFRPREDNRVKIFTCGPSTYRRPHVGNYRTFLYEDILVRYLEYLGFEVQRVINFTDIEDKMLAEAVKLGIRPDQIARDVAEHFFRESSELNIELPADIPRASTSVDQAVRIIQELVKKGFAYWHEGNVFFDPLKHEGFGRLFRLDMSRWPKQKVRFKKDTYRGRRWNRGDFILWHGHENGDVGAWHTEIGYGRPSWNIQDPAMVIAHLGPEIDINCGGIDNIYRHHDYNIAVIESYSGRRYANYYLHGEHLVVDGKTMSKSRGNILYPEDIYAWGFKPHHLRYFLVSTHYRRKLNLTQAAFAERSRHLDELRARVSRLLKPAVGTSSSSPEAAGQPGADRAAPPTRGVGRAGEIIEVFEKRMNEDLSIGTALEELDQSLARIESGSVPRPGVHDLRAVIERVNSVARVLL
jgi:cysteinyl-tRNA synthetase